jgi:hypothetical protein
MCLLSLVVMLMSALHAGRQFCRLQSPLIVKPPGIFMPAGPTHTTY